MNAFIGLILAVAMIPQQPPQNGVIEGTVLRSGTMTPIEGAIVELPRTNNSNVIASVVTDAKGHFLIPDVTPGYHSVRISKDGYLGRAAGPVAVPALISSVTLKAGQHLELLPFNLIKAATVSGRVLDENKAPAVNYAVEFLQLRMDPQGRKTWESGQRTQTDDRGEYREFRLSPGNYFIRAAQRALNVPASSTGDLTTAYFPGVSDPDGAVAISITDGGDVVADFVIPSAARYSVSGKVVNGLPGTTKLPRLSIVLLPDNPNAPVEGQPQILEVIRMDEGNSGEFEIRNVRPGNYDMFVSAMSPSSSYLVKQVVQVAEKDVVNVSVLLVPGVDLKGHLKLDGISGIHFTEGPLATILASGATGGVAGGGGGGGASQPEIRVTLTRKDGFSGGMYRLGPLVDAARTTFTFPNVPEGDYVIGVSGAVLNIFGSDTYVADIRRSGQSVYDEGLKVSTEPIDDLDIVISSPGGSVNATVVDKKEGMEVQLLLAPDSPHQDNAMLYRLVTQASSNKDGTTRLRGIPPGQYKMFAFLSPQGGSIPVSSPEFAARFAKDSTSVKIEKGITSAAQVHISKIVP